MPTELDAVTAAPLAARRSSWAKRTWQAVLVLALLAIGGRGASVWWQGPQVEVLVAVRADIVQTVVASGRVASPARIGIGSQIIGQVDAVPVIEGQVVASGQLLIGLEASDADAVVESARAAVSQADARLRQLRDVTLPVAEQGLAQALANLGNVQHQYDRVQELRLSALASQAEVDEIERGLRVAKSQGEVARLQARSVRGGGPEDGLAAIDLRLANARLQAAVAGLAHTKIKAPVAGTLIARNVERGDIVQPGSLLMELSPAGRTQLVVQFDERNLRYLAVGQVALVVADAYPGERFTARLAFINPGVDASRGSIAVKLDVDAPPDFLRQDMTVSVDLEVARLPGALSLPPQAVRDVEGQSPWVMLVVHGRTVRRDVRIGVRGDSLLQVRDGLVEGDRVLPGSGNTVIPGARVRAVGGER